MGQRPLGLGCPQQGCLGGSAVPFADICAIASQERPIPSGVYAAYQGSMHRNVAVKILEDAPLSTEGASRFEREAWIAGSLSHPNIVKVHAYGIERNPLDANLTVQCLRIEEPKRADRLDVGGLREPAFLDQKQWIGSD